MNDLHSQQMTLFKKRLQAWGRIFSRVRPFYERAVSKQQQTCERTWENQTFGMFSWKSLTKVVTCERKWPIESSFTTKNTTKMLIYASGLPQSTDVEGKPFLRIHPPIVNFTSILKLVSLTIPFCQKHKLKQ